MSHFVGDRNCSVQHEIAIDLSDDVIAEHLADPLAGAHALIAGASTRYVYDVRAYERTRNDARPRPVAVCTIVLETHPSDLPPGHRSKLQQSFSYCDGFGREIQRKVQAEPVPAGPRWIGSGWTIFNNKGKPVRRYEPFFSATHHYEHAQIVGTSPTFFYDPPGRVEHTPSAHGLLQRAS